MHNWPAMETATLVRQLGVWSNGRGSLQQKLAILQTPIPSEFLAMAPYLATIVLVLEAAQDGIVHVILCLVFWPYQLYYVWVESDNGPLKILYLLNVAAGIAVRVFVFQNEVG